MAETKPKRRTPAKKPVNAKTAAPAKQFKLPYEVKLLLLVGFTILLAVFLYTSSAGFIGRFVRKLTLGTFGFTGYVIPWVIFFIALLAMNPNFSKIRTRMIAGLIFVSLGLLLIFGLVHLDAIKLNAAGGSFLKASYAGGQTLSTSGLIGDVLTAGLSRAIGATGLTVVTIFSALIGMILLLNVNLKDIREDFALYRANARERREANRMRRQLQLEERQAQAELQPPVQPVPRAEQVRFRPEPEAEPVHQRKITMNDFSQHFEKRSEEDDKPIPESLPVKPEEVKADDATEKVEPPSAEETKKLEGDIAKGLSTKAKAYRKPSVNLLKRSVVPKGNHDAQKKQILDTAARLEEVLFHFGVKAKVVEISRGPIINRFEIELEPGTKISKITGLSDDLALNLAVSQVRVAAVPGKVAVGIEVPNEVTSMVYVRDIIDTREFREGKSLLKIALGKDISGNPIVPDLAKMPHLLVAGTTGSGKSVCMHTIVTSLLFNASPDEVKLLMIDPKVVELNVYNGIPHLILPVVTDPKKAAIALGWAVNEMTRRYELFASVSSKDVESYNEKFPEEKLPKIVILIDELSDLMMVAPNQVEDAIARLAQMARAAGIHLIVATQRPSVDVITGLIKANIPSRISFAVSSQIDSRTILDMSGAEKLLGKGDMLFLPIETNRPRRVQGAFISEAEIAAIVESVKKQEIEVEYDEDILNKPAAVEYDEFEDELLEDAIRLVIDMKQASASMLQRRFRIGYNRAGRLIDMMEERGIVGPPQGSKPRDVLVDSFGEDEDETE